MVVTYGLTVNTRFTPYSLSKWTTTGRNTGGIFVQCCWFGGVSLAQWGARDGLFAQVCSVQPIPAAVNTRFTVYSLSNSPVSGRNIGDRSIQYCWSVDDLGVQYHPRDGIHALDCSAWPMHTAVNTRFTVYSLSNRARLGAQCRWQDHSTMLVCG